MESTWVILGWFIESVFAAWALIQWMFIVVIFVTRHDSPIERLRGTKGRLYRWTLATGFLSVGTYTMAVTAFAFYLPFMLVVDVNFVAGWPLTAFLAMVICAIAVGCASFITDKVSKDIERKHPELRVVSKG